MGTKSISSATTYTRKRPRKSSTGRGSAEKAIAISYQGKIGPAGICGLFAKSAAPLAVLASSRLGS